MVVTVSTDATDSTSIAFSTSSRSSRTRSKISLAVRTWFARSISMGILSVTPATQPFKVRGGQGRDVFGSGAAHLGELLKGFGHHERLIALPAIRYGRKIGRIGFN